jgi:hypothetical protein
MAKKPAQKSSVKKVAKPVKSARKAPRKTKAATRPAAGARAKKVAATVRPRAAAPESLGRPLVTAEEKLYLLFKEDYHARQIFEFLRVDTVGELEDYSPHQIIQILSLPLRKTVERIRHRLAEQKRHLRDDMPFALAFQSTQKGDDSRK